MLWQGDRVDPDENVFSPLKVETLLSYDGGFQREEESSIYKNNTRNPSVASLGAANRAQKEVEMAGPLDVFRHPFRRWGCRAGVTISVTAISFSLGFVSRRSSYRVRRIIRLCTAGRGETSRCLSRIDSVTFLPFFSFVPVASSSSSFFGTSFRYY